MSALGDVLGRLQGVRRNGSDSSYVACCPAHDDKRPSLSVGEGDEGRVLLKCFAGCDTSAIMRAIDLPMSALFAPETRRPTSGQLVSRPDWAAIRAAADARNERELRLLARQEQESRPFRLLSPSELEDLPEPAWIIDGAIPQFGIVGVLGPKGTLKTFVTLYVGLSVALGRGVHGRRAGRHRVLYVYAEGSYGAKQRLRAACEYLTYADGVPIDRASLPMSFLPRRIAINDPAAMALLLEEIERSGLAPNLIIIDTLNANLDGDEDGRGMNGFLAGCYGLRDQFEACVLVVHHTPLSDDRRGRGHSALDGALDTRLIVNRDADRVTVECTHQRNGSDGWRWDFETVPVAGSLALREVSPTSGNLSGNRRLVLQTAHEGSPRKFTALLNETELTKATFKRALSWLKSNGYIRVDGTEYHVTDAGKQALGLTGLTQGSDDS